MEASQSARAAWFKRKNAEVRERLRARRIEREDNGDMYTSGNLLRKASQYEALTRRFRDRREAERKEREMQEEDMEEIRYQALVARQRGEEAEAEAEAEVEAEAEAEVITGRGGGA